MRENADSLLCLPGTAEEKRWLEDRLEILSVKEKLVLAAAVERSPPRDMKDAVNCLLTLDEYNVIPAGSYERLGECYLEEQCIPQDQIPFFDKAALGEWYADRHPGSFIGNCYVSSPEGDVQTPYDGTHLPTDAERLDWSVRLKLASKSVPEGVWVKFPDYDEFNEGKASDFRLALDALKAGALAECTLLEARCVLPCVQDLAGQYADLADLVYDGQDLGIMLDERGQGSPGFLERVAAALQFENCSRLDDAVRVIGNLRSYDIVNVDAFLDQTMQELGRQEWSKGGEGIKNCFDYVAYAAARAEQQGYTLTDDGQSYIRNRDSPVQSIRQDGMTMQ